MSTGTTSGATSGTARADEAREDEVREGEARRTRLTLRLVTACVLLTGLAFVQSPGLVVSDTKFDLVVDPAGFLGRAFHLWDPEGSFGQLQNQAYGYLWPMGPFFVVGDGLGLPPWVVQRLWWALVLCVAFVGAALLARALGVRSDLAILLGAAAYALSPRMVTVLGPISIEAWPSALAPWVLLALVVGSQRGSPRRAAALAGLGVAMVGGVNAAATFAVIPLGAVWVLTRPRGPRRTALLVWWPFFTLLGTLWWLVPLFLMGAYSPPFLDFIETASATTFPTTVVDTLRGTSNWVPYVDGRSRSGNELVTTSYLALNSGVVLLLGAVGLLDRRTPHRPFLAAGLAVGLLMVTAGHTGAVTGWFAPEVGTLLDGVLAPLRNVHKFDPVLRLPLVLGLAFLVDHAVSRRQRSAASGRVLERAVLLATAVAVVAGAALPALGGRLAPTGGVEQVPDHWHEAAAWLAEQDRTDPAGGGAVALLAPGSRFADYAWGSTRDEPLQFLADSRWAVRNVVPLTPPGTIRMLDGVEERLSQGEGGPGLAAYLQRAGIRFVVVRNDLVADGDLPSPTLVHQALDASPGLEVVARFGPEVGGDAAVVDDDGARTVLQGGWLDERSAIEVYEVPDVVASATQGVPDVVVGGPEDLADLLDVDAVGPQGSVLATDAPRGPDDTLGAGLEDARVVLTDGLRAREHNFARINDGDSPVLTGSEARTTGNPQRDYLIDTDDRWSTTARITGAAGVTASSSASDAGTFGAALRGYLPYAAVDGSRDTSWYAGTGSAGRAWWRLDLEEPIPAGERRTVTVVGGDRAAPEQLLRLVWPDGRSDEIALGPDEVAEVEVGGDVAVTWLRVEDASPAGEQDISLAEVDVPDVEVQRWYVLPRLPAGWPDPDQVVLRPDRDGRDGCAVVGRAVRCAAGLAVPDEEPGPLRRIVDLPSADAYAPLLRVRPLPADDLGVLLQDEPTIGVVASSTAVDDVRASAVAAVDGDAGTTWMADPDDLRPELTVEMLGERTIGGVRVALDEGTAARAPTQLLLRWSGGLRLVDLEDGRATFPEISTDRLTVQVLGAEADVSAPGAGGDEPSVGISELSLTGVRDLPLEPAGSVRSFACGTGPTVQAGDAVVRTRLLAAPSDLLAGREVPAVPCDRDATLALAEGENRVVVVDSPFAATESLVLERDGARPVATAEPDDAHADLAGTERDLDVSAPAAGTTGAGVAVVRENANPGWQASQDGEPLAGLTIDGWQQGWVLDGDAPVEVRYGPDGTYRVGIAAGLVVLLGLAAGVVGVRLLRRHGSRPEPGTGRGRHVGPLVVVPTAVLALGLLGGTVGAVVGAVVAVVVVAVAARSAVAADEVLPWLLGLPLFAACVGYALQPWGSTSGWAGASVWPQVLALVTVAGVLVRAALQPDPPPEDEADADGRTDAGSDRAAARS